MFSENKAKEPFQAGLQYLVGEAMADEDLIAYLRTNQLYILLVKELSRKTKLEKAVEDCRKRFSELPHQNARE
jgi:hypothetical protein